MSLNGNKGKAYYDGKEIEFKLPGNWSLLVKAEPRAVSELDNIFLRRL
ncbi:MAG: hypothetical protein JRH18_06405 [Deltaproteobacteria bacterium]|nr:hypothetical protein [Deltaproteobacteria bacterium]MBW1993943.1 hypothetical protein [Deltaproteobacteria bacterium]MBW2151284.1 hypothetical protein [Deltaproteobacteria bacterium]